MNEHDKFFREVFSRKEEVVDFLNGTFPANIATKIDYSSLTIDNTDYISQELKEFYSDVVYNCLYNHEIPLKIALLFEHKSYVPTHPHLQLLRYMLSIWESQLKSEPPQQLMPVIPIIVYHGKDKWIKKDWHKYFKNYPAELLDYLPEFDYQLADLSGSTDDKIKQQYQSLIMQMSLLLLKNIFDDDFLSKIIVIFARLNELFEKHENYSFFIQVVHYIYNTTELDLEKFKKHIEKLTIGGGELTMTTAQKLIQQGRLEGRQEGRQEGEQIGEQIGELLGKFEVALLMHKKCFAQQLISELTQLSLQQVDSLIELFAQHGENSITIVEQKLKAQFLNAENRKPNF